MPHTRSDVRAHVGVELQILDAVGQVVVVPRAILELVRDQPLVGALGFGPPPSDCQRHRCLDVVPGIGVTARVPEDQPVGQLLRRDRVERRVELASVEHALDLGDAAHRASGFCA